MAKVRQPIMAEETCGDDGIRVVDSGKPSGEPAARSRGSPDEFARDWIDALATGDRRRLAYPDWQGGQVGLAEWVKAQDVVALLDELGLERPTVLEYGCGSAGISIYLRERGVRAFGLDLSADGLRVARWNDRAHRRAASSALPLILADTLALPLADASIDATMSFGLWEHFDAEGIARLLAELRRVTRPGGLCLADVIPRRWNARHVGNLINASGAALKAMLRGRPAQVATAYRAYFDHYYETDYAPEWWAEALTRAGFADVRVRVCRPFPPLALGGDVDRLYAAAQRALLPLWRRFDRSASPLARRWGWMYFVTARVR